MSSYQKDYALRNSAKKRAATKLWRQNNPEKARKACKNYYEANKEALNQYNREYYQANREECVEYAREYRRQNPLAHMKSQYRHVSGIPDTKAECCEICGSDERVVMDHCHSENVFRGWICNDCNLALGFAADDSERLRKMADYLDLKVKVSYSGE